MNIKQHLIDTLAVLPFDVFLQGTIAEGENYPEGFFTFWNDDVEPIKHYDNTEEAFAWTFTVIFYSSSPELVNTVPFEAINLLKKAGFIPQGKGMDIPSDEPTHTGRALEVVYIEKINNKGE